MKVFYQGVIGSFSYITAKWYFKNAEFRGVQHFKDIYESIKNNKNSYGVVPIENSLVGSIYENYDLLLKYDVQVIAESNLKIEHHLLGLPQSSFANIQKVYSHPKALEQCNLFFEQNPQIEEVVFFDTAGAAELVKKKNDSTLAAIASNEAAEIYSLKKLKSNLGDQADNWTRFFIIGRKQVDPKIVNKASFIFILKKSNKPGSLHRALKTFADHKLNLTKIESRPIVGKPFEYFFYIDFEFDNKHLSDVKEALKKLGRESHLLKVLGFYRKDPSGKRK